MSGKGSAWDLDKVAVDAFQIQGKLPNGPGQDEQAPAEKVTIAEVRWLANWVRVLAKEYQDLRGRLEKGKE